MGSNYSYLKNTKTKFPKKKKDPECFIINYSKTKKQNTNISDIDSRRIIFVSLVGAFKTWNQVPLLSLYSCIFIVPIKRDWLYDPYKYRSEIDATFIGEVTLFQDNISDVMEFIKLLQWKDSQGLVLFTMDKPNTAHCSYNIHPFWNQLSDKLSLLYDPITKGNYQALKLDDIWWITSFRSENARFESKYESILSELYSLNTIYKSMQEILYQSNPESLNPIISYSQTSIDISAFLKEIEDDSGLVIFNDYLDD